MKTPTEIKRKDGSKVKIIAEAIINYSNEPIYRIDVHYCEPKKRTWKIVDIGNNYVYRSLPFGGEERKKMLLDEQLKYVSIAEINDAMMNAWESIKPILLT